MAGSPSEPSKDVMSEFLGHLDGGACVNQRALVRALTLFGRKQAAPGNKPIRLHELLDALWMLDLLIAHEKVTFDGTILHSELELATNAADEFSNVTRWRRRSIGIIKPPKADRRYAMLADSARSAFSYMDVGITLDEPLAANEGEDFFKHLLLGRPLAQALATNPTYPRRKALLDLSKMTFRGSKCVAGLVANGPEFVDRALATAKAQPALAASILINRFRFDYLRALARSVGDVYIPGDAWRPLSHRNAALSFHALSSFMEDKYLKGVREALRSEENAVMGTLPPLGLYCLMKADSTGGPLAIIQVAAELIGSYRRLLKQLAKEVARIGDDHRDEYVQRSGISELEPLEEEIERELTDKLGALEQRANKARSPSVVTKFLTSVLGEGTKSAASDAAKDAAKDAGAEVVRNAATVGVGAVAGAAAATALPTVIAGAGVAVAGSVVGAAAGLGVVVAAKAVRHAFLGHVDSYRSLHSLLSASSFQYLNPGVIESRVERLLGRKLTM